MEGSSLYLAVKALHIVAVISWMAGLLYLPRLFVYHAEAKVGSQTSETFKIMERRLLKAITTPAMIASWVLGLVLVFGFEAVDWTREGWFHAKLALVVALTAFHGALARWRKDFETDRNAHTPRFFRIVNEIPTVIMIAVVFLVIMKPF